MSVEDLIKKHKLDDLLEEAVNASLESGTDDPVGFIVCLFYPS
jgi:hypothetical protein